jgi:oligoribonuclease
VIEAEVCPPYLVWIDLEMTGLNPQIDRIIEIATIVTDNELNVIAEGPVLAIHQPDLLLDQMNEWCTKVHGESGLTARVKASTVTEAMAEEQTLAFLSRYLQPNMSPICGNSVWQDRRFLNAYMQKLNAFFHYRMIDVSTIKELARRWRPELYASFTKETSHRALDDIRESIDELKFYREHFLVSKKTSL